MELLHHSVIYGVKNHAKKRHPGGHEATLPVRKLMGFNPLGSTKKKGHCGNWLNVLVACLIMALLPQSFANSCTTDADASFCGGFCESSSQGLLIVCPMSYCSTIGSSCSFYWRGDNRCQCQGGHFCGYYSGGTCTNAVRSTPVSHACGA
jgi:hypothetical protein